MNIPVAWRKMYHVWHVKKGGGQIVKKTCHSIRRWPVLQFPTVSTMLISFKFFFFSISSFILGTGHSIRKLYATPVGSTPFPYIYHGLCMSIMHLFLFAALCFTCVSPSCFTSCGHNPTFVFLFPFLTLSTWFNTMSLDPWHQNDVMSLFSSVALATYH